MSTLSLKPKINYIDKKLFSQQVEDYVLKCKELKEKDQEVPIVPDEIAKGFLLICENLSHSRNFINYTYREDMVMDAVENCLKAIHKFNPLAKTKSGKVNAFGYFTRVSWNAMVRRIKKENAEIKGKETFIQQSTPLDFIDADDEMAIQYIEHIIGNTIKEE